MELDLGKGRIALIDDEDWTRVRKHYWRDGSCVEVAPCDVEWRMTPQGYVCSKQKGRRALLLHRLIMECPSSMVVDHKDSTTTDNRKSNLRVCGPSENARNSRLRKRKRCKYKGVVWVKRTETAAGKPYRARVAIAGMRKVYAGYHATQLSAAMAHDDLAVRVFGEFARLNFPERQRAKAINVQAA
jgi:hypothetical protein